MLKYKIDVLEALKIAGYSTYILRKQNILGESAIQSLRDNKGISWSSLEKICELLNCQPSDIILSITEHHNTPDEANEDNTTEQ